MKNLYLTLTFLLCCSVVPAQNQIPPDLSEEHSARDSLVNMLDWYTDFAKAYPQEGLKWEPVLQSFATRFEDDSLLALTHNLMGTMYRSNAIMDSAMINQMRAVSYAFAAEDTIFWIKTLANLSSTYQDQADFASAIKINFKALELAEQEKDTNVVLVLHINRSYLYTITEDLDLARHSLETALELSHAWGDLRYIPDILIGLATTEQLSENLELARSYWLNALSYAQENDQIRMESIVLSNLALTMEKMEDWDTAIVLLKQAYKIDHEMENPMFIANSGLSLGGALAHVGEHEAAKPYLEEAISIYDIYGLPENAVDVYRLLSESMEPLDEWKLAYQYALKWKYLSDSLLSLDYKVEVAELEKKYQNEKDALTILELERQGERDQWRFQTIVISLVGGIGILVALLTAIILYSRKRQSDAKRAALELEHRLLQAQMNPHFLFNSLNTLRHFHLQQEFGKADEYLVRFSHMLRGVLENSNQQLVTLEDELETLKDYISIEKMRFGKEFTYEIEIDEDIEEDIAMVPPLVLQPFVENAILHGIANSPRDGALKIVVSPVSEDKLRCLIQDNGVGYEVSRRRKESSTRRPSRGIEITKGRLGGQERVTIRERKGPQGGVEGTDVEIIMDFKYAS